MNFYVNILEYVHFKRCITYLFVQIIVQNSVQKCVIIHRVHNKL